MDLWGILGIIAQIIAYVIGIAAIIQIIKIILGGSWEVEEAILALIGVNITISFGIMSYLINQNSKISRIDKTIHSHIQWHKGRDSEKKGK